MTVPTVCQIRPRNGSRLSSCHEKLVLIVRMWRRAAVRMVPSRPLHRRYRRNRLTAVNHSVLTLILPGVALLLFSRTRMSTSQPNRVRNSHSLSSENFSKWPRTTAETLG